MSRDLAKRLMAQRQKIQIVLGIMFILLNIVLFFVWKDIAYLPLIMLPVMIISTFKWSRGFCGWACPRAAFLERLMRFFSLNRPVPQMMQSLWLSGIIFVVLISRVTYVGFTNGIWAAGFLLCIVPTAGALLLGWYSPKAWCAVCPTGTLLKTIDRGVFRVYKKEKCNHCGICDQNCPMGISISDVQPNSYIHARNCTQCGLCVASCSKNILELPQNIEKREAISDLAI